ncbi:cyclopropane-fatty-acyl-phospholipid synthase, partial [Aspergillus brunneoviolaceus CBS 621.78]
GRVVYALQYSKDDPLTYLGDTGAESQREVLVVVKTPRFWSRLLAGADLGFAESYMLQDIDCEVDQLLKLFQLLSQHRGGFRRSWLHQFATGAAQMLKRSNDVEQAQINISAHYDTSNVLFANILSPDMNYSCAHWSAEPTETLETAQRRKVQTLLRKARILAGHHILDIGCGWGDLSIQAALTHPECRVTGITLSREQKSWAEARIQAVGLQDRVEILFCDYRQVSPPGDGGYYDRIISVGMFEHVGREYLPEYFATISRLLDPKHGILVLDGITAINRIHGLQARSDLFMLKYIFPGGYLPTIGMLLDHIHEGSGKSLEVTSAESSGSHYGKSLQVWRENFTRNWEAIREDYEKENPSCTAFEVETFRRKWLYYFVVAETSFRLQLLNNFTITAARTPGSALSYES